MKSFYVFLFSFVSLSNLIYYLITLRLKYLHPEGAYFSKFIIINLLYDTLKLPKRL